LVQFGISYTQDESLKAFADSIIMDDPQLDPPIPFDEGVISFAGSGPNSRSSQLFIAYRPAKSLGKQLWETPIGTVIEGMETIRRLNSDYGDMPPWGNGPEQHKIRKGGKAYIEEEFPKLDYFIHCSVERVVGEIKDVEESIDVVYNQENRDIKNDVGSASSTTHKKDDHKQPAENRTGLMDHIALPIFAAITVFFILSCLTRRKKKIMDKNV